MKLRGTIVESPLPKDSTVIVRFQDDKKKQHFEVKCENFNPYAIGMRKWDSWDLVIKFESEIFTEPKSGDKSYFTHLVCTKASLYHENGTIGENYK
ncbi:hypothetical protein [Chryseobacterium flavum]|uniref:hypothetical protein n=1 Tax=Chryseobacterium flavum TaxID=415851 RepID=UPI0028ADBBFF|nr:hypothetical protein [Chryseobacterium flavum]